MTKKRIRYSQLSPRAPEALPATPALAELRSEHTLEYPVVAPAPTPAPAAETAPAKRVSTPVELARALAAEKQAAEDAVAVAAPVEQVMKEELADLLMFRVGAERFAVELLAVDEVIDLPVIHFVPEMPAAMVGVVNVRGSLTPVFTPHGPLGLPLAQSDAVLIFRHQGARVGILIDDVEDAFSVDLRELRATPGTTDHDEVVLGVVRHEGALVAVADVSALIAACQCAAVLETA